MKTLTRILLPLLFSILTILLLSSLPASAKTYNGTCGDDLTWILDTSTGILTINGTGDMTSAPWYNYRTNITSVAIGDSVTSIDSSAFYGCNALTSITIGSGVTNIGSCAFLSCNALENVYTNDLASWCNITFDDFFANPIRYADNFYINGTLATDITIPDGITAIGDYAFYYCKSLTSVTIPSSVTSISSEAFSGCSNLTDLVSFSNVGTSFSGLTSLERVTLGYGITSISDSAFEGCTSLASITIPDSVTSIGDWAFYTCANLVSVTVPDSVTSIGIYAFASCTSLTSVTLGNSVTSIGNYAFSGCRSITDLVSFSNVGTAFSELTSLERVTFGNGVTSIDYKAFYNCTSLTSITISDSATSVSSYAFSGCSNVTDLVSFSNIGTAVSGFTSLERVTLGNGVTVIAEKAFYNCNALTSITIPNSVTSIGSSAFSGCTALSNVCINDLTQWCNITFDGTASNPLCYADNLYVNGTLTTDFVIPNGITEIKNYAFYGCGGLTSITIPNGVTSIGSYAFSGCVALTSITIPNGVTSIGSYAFSGCTALMRITISDSVTSIGNYAFYDCTALTSITIPDSVTSIGSYAFRNCSALTNVTIFNNVTSIDSHAFYDCTALTDLITYSNVESTFSGFASLERVTLGDGVTNIADKAFYNCTALTSVTISDSVTSVGSHAFYDCTALANITIPDNVTSIGSSAFSGCIALTSATIGNNVTSIGSSAFSGCTALASITIPDSVTSIGSSAFLGCTAFTSITIPDSVTSIGEKAFYNCTALTSITIGNGVTSIGKNAFYNCSALTDLITYSNVGTMFSGFTSLERVTLSNGATDMSIDSTAFKGCTALASVIIGSSVTSISSSAFSGCSSLTDLTSSSNVGTAFSGFTSLERVTFGNGVTTIDDSAFSGCTALTNVTIPDSVTSIGSSAFSGCTALTSITIPDNVTSIGEKAFYNCTVLASITIPDNVTSIGSAAFSRCTALTSVTIPNSITEICGFSGCTALTSITIPDSVTSIGSSAFSGCTALTSITIPDGVTSIGDSAFYECDNLADVYVIGSESELSRVSIGTNNTCFTDAAFHYTYTSEEDNDEALKIWDGSVADTFAGGFGTQANPYKISTASQLAKLANNSDNNYYYVLINDIYLNDISLEYDDYTNTWTSIYAGHFDGQGHCIYGLYGSALFDSAGTLQNIRISDSYIYSTLIPYSGAIANTASYISGCSTSDTVTVYNATSSSYTAYIYAGGIAGYAKVVDQCYNEASVYASAHSYGAAGGIVGYGSGATITNCYNLGHITAGSSYYGGYYAACGGIVGCANYGSASISYCYNIGKVQSSMYGGGIIGLTVTRYPSILTNCYALGSLAGYGASSSYRGYTFVDCAVLDESEAKSKSSYVGFDFDSIWKIRGKENDGYPILRCFDNNGSVTRDNKSDESYSYFGKIEDYTYGSPSVLKIDGVSYPLSDSAPVFLWSSGKEFDYTYYIAYSLNDNNEITSWSLMTGSVYTLEDWNPANNVIYTSCQNAIIGGTLPTGAYYVSDITLSSFPTDEIENWIYDDVRIYTSGEIVYMVLHTQSGYGTVTAYDTSNPSVIYIDGVSYQIDSSLSAYVSQKALNQKVVYTIVDGSIAALLTKDDILGTPLISISCANSKIYYIDGQYTEDTYSVTLKVSNNISSSYTGSVEFLQSLSDFDLDIDVGTLTISGANLISFAGGNSYEFVVPDGKTLLHAGETCSFSPVPVYVNTSYIPSSGDTSYISCELSGFLGGVDTTLSNTQSVAVKISASSKTSESTGTASFDPDEYADDLTLNETVAWDSVFASEFLTADQKEQIGYALLTDIVVASAPESTFENYVAAKVIKQFLGAQVKSDLGITTLDLSLQVRIDTAEYGQLVFEFSCEGLLFSLKNTTFGTSPMSIKYEIVSGDGMENVPEDKLSGFAGMISYADKEKFITAVNKVLKNAIIDTFAVGGKEIAKLSDLYNAAYGDVVIDVLKAALKADNVSSAVKKAGWEIITYPIKLISIKCPVDVYVYDETGNLCTSVTDNIAETYSENIEIEVSGGVKTFTLLGGENYTFTIQATAGGTMDITVEELSGTDRVMRTIDYNELPLEFGASYKGTTDMTLLSSSPYTLESNETVISSDSEEFSVSTLVKYIYTLTLDGVAKDSDGSVTVPVQYTAYEDTDAYLIIALYDENGEQISLTSTPISGSGDLTKEFADASSASLVKVFIWSSPDSLSPMSTAVELSID